MDSPQSLQKEWQKSDMLNKISDYYDRIWVYGPQNFWNPLEGLDISKTFEQRMIYTGFLRRDLPASPPLELHHIPENFILVTTGGGGDGSPLIEQVLSARELEISDDFPLLMVLGPFMKTENRERIRLRASALPNITVLDFESKMEMLLDRAIAVVGMCGYNTFCEVLSFDKKALFVPRVQPRQEQYIRASRARELGWCEMLTPEEASVPKVLAQMLSALPDIETPSNRPGDIDLDGLVRICADVENLVSSNKQRAQPVADTPLEISAAK